MVRYCARFVPDQATAEDLAQETLIVAWQHAHDLRDSAARAAWLAGIARRRCLMWGRRQQREMAHLVERPGALGRLIPLGEDLSGDGGPERELKRNELAHVLDRALALLPAETGQALAQHYVDGLSQAEVAARLGVSEGAVAVRLHRGKLAVRRLLARDAEFDATAYGHGYSGFAVGGWQETRVWCPQCSARTLLASVPRSPGTVAFRCPACHPDPAVPAAAYRLANTSFHRLVGGLVRPATILKKTAAWAHAYFGQALVEGAAVCTHCGRPARLQLALQGDASRLATDPHALSIRCAACGEETSSSFKGLMLNRPEAQRFWQRHRRMRALPLSEVDTAGQPALVARFESVTSAARLDILSAWDTLAVLRVEGDASEDGEG